VKAQLSKVDSLTSATEVDSRAHQPLLHRHPVVRFVIVRVAWGLFTLFVVSVLIFVGTAVLPGDAARAFLGRSASPGAVAALRGQLGLHGSIVEQYWHWASHFVQGDLGHSAASVAFSNSSETVGSLIRGPLGNSLVLAGITIAILIPVAVLVGTLLATRVGGAVDHGVSYATLGAISLPEFVTGAILIAVLATALGWLPPVSLIGPGDGPLTHPNILVLPVLTLLCATLAQIVRMARASMIEALRSEYVIAARLGGVSERRVLRSYALRNALAPTVQVIALNMQWLVGGIVVTETVFGYPGLGQTLVNAVNVRDIPTVQSIALLLAAFYISVNILADLIVLYLVPKLRTVR
jgi:peptide/nickel transport system permease protein